MKARIWIAAVVLVVVVIAGVSAIAFTGGHTDDPFTYPTPGVTCIGPPPGLIGDGVCHD